MNQILEDILVVLLYQVKMIILKSNSHKISTIKDSYNNYL